jgi:hypothetical protein
MADTERTAARLHELSALDEVLAARGRLTGLGDGEGAGR